jgi:nucleoside-diphosphate-sugar epimerase
LNALVTGSTGFIGRELVKGLAADGWRVACLVRPRSDESRLAGLPVVIQRGDYDDPAAIRRAVEDAEVVYHAGAVLGAGSVEAYERGNVIPTRILAKACVAAAPRLRRFVYVSSIAAGGPSSPGRLKSESDASRPVSAYGRSKLQAEETLRAFGDRLPFVSIRLPNVLGIGQRETETALGLIRRGILPIFGNGDRQTSLCFVQDAVQALILAGGKSAARGEFYYVTDGRTYAWGEIVEALAAALPRRRYVRLRTPSLFMVASISGLWSAMTGRRRVLTRHEVMSARRNYWTFDNRKIREDLGFEPRADFREEIRRIAKGGRED